MAHAEGTMQPKFVGTLDISERYRELGHWAESDLYLTAPPTAYLFSQFKPSVTGTSVDWKLREFVPTDFDLIETSHEFKEVAVSSKSGEWVQVRINNEPGWIKAESADVFSSYLTLINGLWGFTFSRRLNIAREPGARTNAIDVTPEMQDEANPGSYWSPYIEILETKSLSETLGEDDWIKIQMLDQQPCKRYEKEPKVVLEGWIPAYDADGEITVWYHSRGC